MSAAVARITIAAIILASQGCGLSVTEADRFANNYWNERLARCGGTYITYQDGPKGNWYAIEEYKNLSIWVRASELTEADKLNGFEWRGQTGFDCSSSRYPLAAAGEWRDRRGFTCAGAEMWKKDGSWGVAGQPGVVFAVHPECSHHGMSP